MKRFYYLLIISFMLIGCTQNLSQSERIALENYESYYNVTLNHQNTQLKSEYYSIEGVITKLEDGSYRYDIFIDQPQIAMRDVIVMVVEDELEFNDQDNIMPSLGIFDTAVNLYPNQVDTSLYFYKGINLNSVIDNKSVALRVMVEFTNSSRDASYHEVIEMKLSYED